MSPEQISSLMGMEADVEKLKTMKVGQAYDMLYRQAAAEKLRRETELLGVEEPERYEIFFDEYGRRMKRDILTGEETQVTGLPPTPTAPPLTMEQRLELKKTPTEIPRGGYWENPTTKDIKWVESGTEPPAGYTRPIVSREREVSPIPAMRFELTKEKAVRDSAVRIRMNLENPAVKGEIDFINQQSDSTSGFIWLEEAKKWRPDTKETIEVKLPKDDTGKQLTMADVRRVAKLNEISVEEVLMAIHERE